LSRVSISTRVITILSSGSSLTRYRRFSQTNATTGSTTPRQSRACRPGPANQEPGGASDPVSE
jgi:hypothetical protein